MENKKIMNAPIVSIQDKKTGKWNLKNKEDGSLISKQWFDNLGTWSSYWIWKYDIFGWDGLIFLEPPVKTGGAYPYSVRAKCYHYSSEGELLSVNESHVCGLSGIEYIKKSKYEL